MGDLSLQNVFGANATQDINTITITKADLPLLVASTNNHAQTLVAAIMLQLLQNFVGNLNDQNGVTITDQNGLPITYDNTTYYLLLVCSQWKTTFSKGYVRFNLIVQWLTPYVAN